MLSPVLSSRRVGVRCDAGGMLSGIGVSRSRHNHPVFVGRCLRNKHLPDLETEVGEESFRASLDDKPIFLGEQVAQPCCGCR